MGNKNKYYCEFCDKKCQNSHFYHKSHANTFTHIYNKGKFYEQFIIDKTDAVLTCPHAQKLGFCKNRIINCELKFYCLMKKPTFYNQEHFFRDFTKK